MWYTDLGHYSSHLTQIRMNSVELIYSNDVIYKQPRGRLFWFLTDNSRTGTFGEMTNNTIVWILKGKLCSKSFKPILAKNRNLGKSSEIRLKICSQTIFDWYRSTSLRCRARNIRQKSFKKPLFWTRDLKSNLSKKTRHRFFASTNNFPLYNVGIVKSLSKLRINMPMTQNNIACL